MERVHLVKVQGYYLEFGAVAGSGMWWHIARRRDSSANKPCGIPSAHKLRHSRDVKAERVIVDGGRLVHRNCRATLGEIAQCGGSLGRPVCGDDNSADAVWPIQGRNCKGLYREIP